MIDSIAENPYRMDHTRKYAAYVVRLDQSQLFFHWRGVAMSPEN